MVRIVIAVFEPKRLEDNESDGERRSCFYCGEESTYAKGNAIILETKVERSVEVRVSRSLSAVMK